MDVDLPVLNASGSVLFFNHLSYKAANGRLLVDDCLCACQGGSDACGHGGPSGAGKSTLLDLMAFRKMPMDAATVSLNGHLLVPKAMYAISSFVEQEDALLGVLTVRETVAYALRLHLPLLLAVNRVLATLGLQSCADQIIGTPISRGISGGEKRRVTAACAMVTFPQILFLDEVTSGLDSTSAREVMSAIRTLAVAEGMFVIATIHQPSLETLGQFTDLIMLSQGKICYSGKVDDLERFFEHWGKPVPRFKTPVEHAMNFLNEDFQTDSDSDSGSAASLRVFYLSTLNDSHASLENLNLNVKAIPQLDQDLDVYEEKLGEAGWGAKIFWNTMVLSERTTINYIRNLLAYGVRLGMYIGMGLMIATIWIRLGLRDSTINDRLSVHFYSMSVAGIPSCNFGRASCVLSRDKKTDCTAHYHLCCPTPLVNIPFLFLCTLFFSLICYWAVGLHPGPNAFFRFLAFLLLAITAAESQVLVVAAILPVFVAALAIGSFLNGFWMSVGGYLQVLLNLIIKARSLPRFWYYSFHYMDYQRYAFELITNSDLRGLTFQCEKASDGSCSCAYPSSTPDSCTVSGDDVLEYLDIRGISYGSWVGIMVSIIVIYRIALYYALRLRSK
ncbi:P-loop containing nucleoside triphosphate hydrolase protein [Desarmillaria tabescens]|uniref:P-loop containing nucleoside triphosphate hydrolase protein n=1 Tax=Armillaria tabescens TaxID=1929756 RepID=A0AA39NMD7_ARMTA|nr:P-loop containing nucleoside triphosphate hydrolase protein [Desarmillaria tabescens]KAK0468291.1 P-loop containing nucleoside triphosphate hydrolase protein [Desarmillaria tabescens]